MIQSRDHFISVNVRKSNKDRTEYPSDRFCSMAARESMGCVITQLCGQGF